MATTTPSEGTILVVDDTADNLAILFRLLTNEGHRVLTAMSGQEALELLALERPELILLDVMMPGLDGYETCRRIKADPDLADIPVIFLTSVDRPGDKMQAFEDGAVDYVVKPVQPREVLARIRVHVSLRRLNDQLRRRNEELAAFSSMVAHDLRSPLSAIMGLSVLLGESATDPVHVEGLGRIARASRRMESAIRDLLMLANVAAEELTLEPLDMAALVERVLGDLHEQIDACRAKIEAPAQWPAVLGHSGWVEHIWLNYISNGLKYGGEPPVLTLGSESVEDGQVRFWVEDNGEGVPEEARERIFAPFVRLTRGVPGHGLGLSIVDRITERLGGTAGVVDGAVGSRFYFTLPAAR